MSERERWIVYPLLFFALGAALRDKFLQHVTTTELQCQRLVAKSIECEGSIACQGVVVFDSAASRRPLVELGPAQSGAAGQAPDRFGVLILRDSDGKELCGVTNNELYVRRINCEGVTVIDPKNPARILAGLGSAVEPPAKPGGKPRRFGVLALNNQEFGRQVGFPAKQIPSAPDDDQGQQDSPAED